MHPRLLQKIIGHVSARDVRATKFELKNLHLYYTKHNTPEDISHRRNFRIRHICRGCSHVS